MPRHPARAAARTSRCATTTLPLHRRRDRPGRLRALDLRAAVARLDADRHDRQRLRRRRPRPHPARPSDDIEYLLDATNGFFGTSLTRVGPQRRLRRRAAADLDRRPEEVGRHLAQGRAVRDLQRDDHDHRRQAHDLAADGEDDRRPRSSSATPATRPAARTRSRSARRSRPRRAAARRGRARRRLRAPRRPLRPPRATTCSRVAAERGELAQPIVADGPPDLLAEAVHAARHEQARSVGDVLLRRTRLGLLAGARGLATRTSRGASRARWRRSSAGTRTPRASRRGRSSTRPLQRESPQAAGQAPNLQVAMRPRQSRSTPTCLVSGATRTTLRRGLAAAHMPAGAGRAPAQAQRPLGTFFPAQTGRRPVARHPRRRRRRRRARRRRAARRSSSATAARTTSSPR